MWGNKNNNSHHNRHKPVPRGCPSVFPLLTPFFFFLFFPSSISRVKRVISHHRPRGSPSNCTNWSRQVFFETAACKSGDTGNPSRSHDCSQLPPSFISLHCPVICEQREEERQGGHVSFPPFCSIILSTICFLFERTNFVGRG